MADSTVIENHVAFSIHQAPSNLNMSISFDASLDSCVDSEKKKWEERMRSISTISAGSDNHLMTTKTPTRSTTSYRSTSELIPDPDSPSSSSRHVTVSVSEDDVVLYSRRWLILAIFSLISMTNAAMWISLSSISSIVKEYYKVSFASANWLAMIFSMTYFFVVASVLVLNKYGLKYTICVGAILNALGGGLKLIGSGRGDFGLAIAGNGLAGLAQCFILFVPPTLAATWFGEKERGIASAIGMLMNMLGVSLGYIMGGTIVPNSNDYDGSVKRGMFTLLLSQAIVSGVLAVLSIALIKNAPSTPPSMSQVLLQERKWEKKMSKRLQNDIELRYYATSNETSANQGVVYEYKDPAPFNMDEFVVGFRKSFKLLWRNKAFHLVMQAYGIFFGLYLAINTILNHICTLNFPGKERQIGMMGSASVIVGLFGMLVSGAWIDKTHKYKLISVADFVLCAASFLGFTLFSVYMKNFKSAFASFCVYGLFSYPYMTIGLEHAAEVAFPVSEGVTSALLLLLANTYGIILTYIAEIILDMWGTMILGYCLVGLYLVGAVIVASTNGKLKRFNADKNARSESVRADIELETTE